MRVLMQKSKKKILAGAVIALAIIAKYKKKEKCNARRAARRYWSREWLFRRYSGRDLTHIATKELQLEDPKSFENFCRLSKNSFQDLLNVVGPLIAKRNTVLRESVSATTRSFSVVFVSLSLLITLRYLATGNTYKDLSYGFRVSVSLISSLVPETLRAIYKSLSGDYLQVCKTTAGWKRVADEFNRKWDFPMCLGAIDGKHIAFCPKACEGSYYYNYKGFNSVILLAVVDANCKFIMVDVGTNGRANDAAAFNASDIGEAIKRNRLNFPEHEELPNTNIKVPYVFVSDDAFRLNSRILKPYNQRQLNENKMFNYRLSRARSVVENAFGILASRFQIFQRPIKTCSVEKVELITLAACTLHNYLNRADEEHESRLEALNFTRLERSIGNRCSDDASEIRDKYRHYFNSVSILEWQEESIKRFNF